METLNPTKKWLGVFTAMSEHSASSSVIVSPPDTTGSPFAALAGVRLPIRYVTEG